MIQLALDEKITPLDRIKNKELVDITERDGASVITFRDCISLVYHAVEAISPGTCWESLQTEFNTELAQQNQLGWPTFTIKFRSKQKRLEATATSAYVTSTNVLTLLLRLLYMENYKRSCGLATARSSEPEGSYLKLSNTCHRVLGHRIAFKQAIDAMTMIDLFKYLTQHLVHYKKIYCHKHLTEYILAKTILDLIDAE